MINRWLISGGNCRRARALAIVGWLGLASLSQASTIMVTNLASSGTGTLRAALAGAQNGDVITFAATGAITNTSGELVISNNVTILGPGPDLLAVSGSNSTRGFRVIGGVTVGLSGLTVRNGVGSGGGITNGGNLALTNCIFTGCRSSQGGSGISGGPPTPMDGVSGLPAGDGGAIFNSGTLQAVNCLFLTNTTSAGGNGGAAFGPGRIGGSGSDGGDGGAVYSIGPATFINCAFGWNSTGAGGFAGSGGSGTASINGAGGPGGHGGNAGNGSAVYCLGGATFTSCTIYSNTAGIGGRGGNGGNGFIANAPGGRGGIGGNGGSGAIYCTGAVQLVACTLANNAGGRGGNGAGGGTGTSNVSGLGGMGGSGGSSGNGGSGGGISGPATNSTVTLQNVLIAQNSVGVAGSAGGGGEGGTGVVAGPAGSSGTNGVAGTGPDLYGAFISNGHNLVGLRTANTGFTNNVPGDQVGTNTTINPKIGALTRIGSVILTCPLQSGSPALDTGDDTLIGPSLNLTSDARGFSRKSGSHVDIGAYENQWVTSPMILNSIPIGGDLQLTTTNVPGAFITVLRIATATVPVTSWGILGQMTETSPGQFQWTDTGIVNHPRAFYLLRNP